MELPSSIPVEFPLSIAVESPLSAVESTPSVAVESTPSVAVVSTPSVAVEASPSIAVEAPPSIAVELALSKGLATAEFPPLSDSGESVRPVWCQTLTLRERVGIEGKSIYTHCRNGTGTARRVDGNRRNGEGDEGEESEAAHAELTRWI
jgi:hypothetical protein